MNCKGKLLQGKMIQGEDEEQVEEEDDGEEEEEEQDDEEDKEEKEEGKGNKQLNVECNFYSHSLIFSSNKFNCTLRE